MRLTQKVFVDIDNTLILWFDDMHPWSEKPTENYRINHQLIAAMYNYDAQCETEQDTPGLFTLWSYGGNWYARLWATDLFAQRLSITILVKKPLGTPQTGDIVVDDSNPMVAQGVTLMTPEEFIAAYSVPPV